ncbi:hypothetical protein G9A89_000779 [Geosiphon pyriformis]|nr:hypothetical protein G9A89_000779 [Geosiphon pyriformis]
MTLRNPRFKVTQNWKSAMVVHQTICSSSNQLSGTCQWSLGTKYTQNPSSQNYLSLLVTPEDVTSNNTKPNHKQTLTSNILPVTIINDKSLTAIFSFELEELTFTFLFNRVMLKEKPIIIIYTDAKIDGHPIKLILNSKSADSIITQQFMDQLGYQVDHAASARIITADRATKTPIGKINDLPIEINGIIVFIKVLVIEAMQY